jgi:hypothetical protein
MRRFALGRALEPAIDRPWFPPRSTEQHKAMRIVVASILGVLLASAAAAGPVRVEIETRAELRDPFLVRVTGHYADFHNGYSRHWKDTLIPAGRRRFIGLGPVNPLLNSGVSVSVYHPEYVTERARSKKTPLLVRPVGFETFRPRAWRDFIAAGPDDAAGRAEQPLAQALGHLQLFLLAWLPAVDEAGGRAASTASLRAYLPLLDEITRFAEERPPGGPPFRLAGASAEQQAAFVRSLRTQELQQRAELAELRRRAHAWVSVPAAARQVVRAHMEQMRSARGLDEELFTRRDRERLGAFLDRYAADKAARRRPEERISWTDPETRIAYRVNILDPPRACAYLGVTTDLTGVVSADLGEMTRAVKGRFCRRATGEWRYRTP